MVVSMIRPLHGPMRAALAIGAMALLLAGSASRADLPVEVFVSSASGHCATGSTTFTVSGSVSGGTPAWTCDNIWVTTGGGATATALPYPGGYTFTGGNLDFSFSGVQGRSSNYSKGSEVTVGAKATGSKTVPTAKWEARGDFGYIEIS